MAESVEVRTEQRLATPTRPRAVLAWIVLLWAGFYASFALARPPLLDDADSVHAEVAREMLLRHDYVTLYANGIRYLEKAPLLYWSMAACLKVFSALGLTGPMARTVAVRLPLAFAVLALALVCESFARRMFRSRRAGLYAALILLSSFGIFIFTRITIPDAMVCLWITTALWCFWRTEEAPAVRQTRFAAPAVRPTRFAPNDWAQSHVRIFCWAFGASCALNVLTKGLIGVVFPVGAVAIYLVLSRGWARAWGRVKELYPWSTVAVFLVIAAPWHMLAGLANPTQGQPTPFR
ncbi:MAG TPA: phospholipid carrier-dependent glycosyltransferase, partial [Acidobacteriaceae bacterium]